MRSLLISGICLLGSSLVQAAPAAPAVTVGASNTKQLQFDWDPVPRANYYELWFKADEGAQWVKQAQTPAQRPRFRIGVDVHLLDWPDARYQVRACNPSGCSGSSEVSVDGLALDAMGYFKPNTAADNIHYGQSVALSADGLTMAVITGERATREAATVQVYRRNSTSAGWYREARLTASNLQEFTTRPFRGSPLAVSGDGNVIALGLWGEYAPGAEPVVESGAVYLFRRSGTSWRQAQRLTGEVRARNRFGLHIDLDDAAGTLIVSHQFVGAAFQPGTVEVYRSAGPSSAFVHETTVLPPVDGGVGWCTANSLSGDGQRLVRTCEFVDSEFRFFQVLSAPGWSEMFREESAFGNAVDTTYDGQRILVQEGGRGGVVYERVSGDWNFTGIIPTGNAGTEYERLRMAISRDGKFIVAGNSSSTLEGVGPVFPPYRSLPNSGSGTVHVYHRTEEEGWTLLRVIKPGSTWIQGFGHAVALGDNGHVLAVGAPFDPSSASGINGDPDAPPPPELGPFRERGAVWVY